MAFTIADLSDLKQLLTEHPDWRAEIRRLILSEQFEEMPEILRGLMESHRKAEQRLTRLEAAVAELTEAQKQAEQRLTRLEAAVAKLTEAQKQAEERLTRLEVAVAKLTEAQKQAEERLTRLEAAVTKLEAAVAKLTEAQKQAEERLTRLEVAVAKLEAAVAELAEAQKQTNRRLARLETDMGDVKGIVLENDYRNKASSYFGTRLRKTRIVAAADLLEELSQEVAHEDQVELFAADLFVRGRLRAAPDAGEVFLVVEVSNTVDPWDVQRAVRRAEILRGLGLCALPVVAGKEVTEEAREQIVEQAVILQRDGAGFYWDEALARWAG